MVSSPPFAVRGVVEGFYGPPYTFPERDGLISFLGRHGFNWYIYGPKNDRQHRNRWREPYPPRVMAQFATTVAVAREAGVRFCYSLSPSVSICYADADDFNLVTAKLGAFYELGVRDFGVLFDDIAPDFRHAADRRAYGSFAEAHADLSNRVFEWLQSLDPACTLCMCPTDYHGGPPFGAYLQELGSRLRPEIEVFYTGPEVCSPTIGAAEVAAFAAVMGRPPLLWDNYPVNDLAMQPELHIGPIRGRDPALPGVTRGVLVNPMLQAEASKLALRTWADYLANPQGYDPERSWDVAIAELAGAGSQDEAKPLSAWALRLLAECALGSCLGGPMAPRLDALANAAIEARERGELVGESPAAQALDAYLTELDEACYHLKNRMGNLALRAELLPWIDLLESAAELGRLALAALAEPGRKTGRLRELHKAVTAHHKRIGGEALLPLAAAALP
jgi:hyaluronoglucosaminidase